MGLWMIVALQAAQAGGDVGPITLLPRCEPISADEVVVCGERRDRYRLPLPEEREPAGRRAGLGPSAAAALDPGGPCGIFSGQRRCSKRDALEFGYGGGRDPITVATRVVKQLADPE